MLATSLGETVHVSYIIATVCVSYGGETVYVSYISDVAAVCCAY